MWARCEQWRPARMSHAADLVLVKDTGGGGVLEPRAKTLGRFWDAAVCGFAVGREG